MKITLPRGHSLKLYKKRSRLMVRANCFSNRVVDTWNSLTEDIENAPSLNAFKSRLNRSPVQCQSILHQRIWNTKPGCIRRGQFGLIYCLNRYIKEVNLHLHLHLYGTRFRHIFDYYSTGWLWLKKKKK